MADGGAFEGARCRARRPESEGKTRKALVEVKARIDPGIEGASRRGWSAHRDSDLRRVKGDEDQQRPERKDVVGR